MVTDPVCKMTFPPEKAAATYDYNQTTYYFCNISCKEKFTAAPELYLSGNAAPEACCCCAEAFEDDYKKIEQRRKRLFAGFIIATLITLLIAVLNYCSLTDKKLTSYLQFALATIAVFGPGGFLLMRGIKSLKGLKLNMFTLISMGISSAYFYSVYALFFADTLPQSLLDVNGNARLHFQAGSMIISLVILGQYLECKASSYAGSAVRSLLEQLPDIAHRVKKCCGSVEDIALEDVVVGDHLKVLPYEKIPVDGIVIEGTGTADESMLTGEALMVDKVPGSPLSGGTLNGNTVLIMQAQQIGKDTLIARIAELVKSARNTKLPIQKLADKVSAVFVPLVLLIALISLLYWGLIAGNWSMALGNFIAVLLAACPCSLGLAAPMAVTVGVGTAAQHGILIKNPAVLEDLRKVDTLMLDKTGTLTENKLTVSQVIIADNTDEKFFHEALFALEQYSNHPLAKTICSMQEFKQYAATLPEVEDFCSMTGSGVSGIVNDIKFVLGNADLLKNEMIDVDTFLANKNINNAMQEKTMLFLGAARKVWGAVIVSDVIRQDAGAVVAELKQRNLDLVILSGDNPAAVKQCAYTLGIEEFYGKLTPQDKLEKVKTRHKFGRYVAMAGDGVNDTAALAAADVSIAMGSGSVAALENASVTLLNSNIAKLGKLFEISNAVNETIRQNLYLAFAYNITLIPLAAGAFYSILNWQFSPVLSSIAMSGSCLLVVGNSLKLKYLFYKQ